MNAFAVKERGKKSIPKRTLFISSGKTKPAQSLNAVNNAEIIQAKCVCGGGCSRCQESHLLQAKLRVGAQDDKYEREADRVADQVLRMPGSAIQRKPG